MTARAALSLGRLTVLAAVLVGPAADGLAYVGSIRVSPADPTATDPVTVRVSGDLPDSCWRFIGYDVSVNGRRIDIAVHTSFVGGACFLVLLPYAFEAAIGYLAPGSYEVTVSDAQSSQTQTLEVAGDGRQELPEYFRRGDANSDGVVDVSDAIATLGALFLGEGDLPCADAADANDDGLVDIADPVFTLGHLFRGGAPIPPPGPRACGRDPERIVLGAPVGDRLGCDDYAPCQPSTADVFHLFDRGIDCFTWPCPYFGAVDPEGEEIAVTDVDLTPLGLPPREADQVRRDLAEGGWLVRGYLLPGPEGPAGIGTTIVVLELLERRAG